MQVNLANEWKKDTSSSFYLHRIYYLNERRLVVVLHRVDHLLCFDKICDRSVVITSATIESCAHTVATQSRENASLVTTRQCDHFFDLNTSANYFQQPLVGVDVQSTKWQHQIPVPQKLLVHRLGSIIALR